MFCLFTYTFYSRTIRVPPLRRDLDDELKQNATEPVD